MALSRSYAKLCDVADWDDPGLLAGIRDVLPERDPLAHVERKAWELGMCALFLADAGRLTEDTEVLAVGAGDERTLFWLADRVGRVVATDVYGEGPFSGREAEHTMLSDPAAHAPHPYREDHLEVRWMDARRLDLPDASFDVVYSLSSFEHFGGPRDIARAAAEAGRVLRPGGHAFLVTECLVRHPLADRALVDFAVRLATLGRKRGVATPWRRARVAELLTPREIDRLIVRASGLELMQPLDLTLSPASWENLTRSGRDGELTPRTGAYHPHVLLQTERSVYTSIALPLVKPAG